jgi:hypothetical protein
MKYESIAKDEFFETIYNEDKKIINKGNKLIKKIKFLSTYEKIFENEPNFIGGLID